ncbi:cache domain-containing sensor histidine kinase [Paenibacillus camerounensis]|uniref:cache domain-containing sensor histidine kinase n=1 Tax=Paenibacillus camerounensis TaxID=1243663 RepID=UPI0005AA3E72|nr:sensor histidine kinase [Paenibacillus camerounensis]
MRKLLLFMHKIRFKMFVIILACMLTVALSISLIAYRYITDLLTEKQMSQMKSYSDRQSEQLERILSDIKAPLGQLAGKLSETDQSREGVTSVLRMYQYSVYPFSRGMYFIAPDHSIYETVQTTVLPEPFMEKLFNGARTSWTSLQTAGPYQSENKGLVLTMAVTVYRGMEIQGILAADIDLLALNELIAGMNPSPTTSILLFNPEIQPILSSVKVRQDEYSGLFPQIQHYLQQDAGGFHPLYAENGGEFVALFGSPNSQDWRLASFVGKQDILAPVTQLRAYAIYLVLFFILLSLVISFFLARYIDGPISGLILQMRRIQKGNLGLRVQLKRKDEFRTLADSFNVMLDHIGELIDDKLRIEKMKKQYEFRALQAQINPHFLYNTLNSINALVDLKRTDEIAKVLHALVNLLDYSMGKGEALTSLRNELQGLKYYVFLQQIRYQNKFEVHYNVDDELLDYSLLKLTLQPIVENAIFHGIKEKRRGDGQIIVGGKQINSRLVQLYVADNGTGIAPDRLAGLLDPSTTDSDSDADADAGLPRYSSMGLRNVHERLQLQFGDAYGLKIETTEGAGTTIIISFPAVKGAPADGH